MPQGQKLGRIIGSGNHADYFISIFRKGEIDPGPEKEDHAIGRFVLIGEGDREIIGIIVSSQLISEEGLRADQYLQGMSAGEMSLFTPELMDGSMTIIKVRGIGIIEGMTGNFEGEGIRIKGNVKMGMPSISPSYQDPVIAMDDEMVTLVHSTNGMLHLEYLRALNVIGDGGTHAAVTNALAHLERILPKHADVIGLIRREMEWKNRITE